MSTSTSKLPLAQRIGFVILLVLLVFAGIIRLDWRDQLLFAAILVAGAAWLNRRSASHTTTLTLALLSTFCTLRYGYWRVSETWTHVEANGWVAQGWDLLFVALLLGAELYAITILVLGYFQTARPLRRTPAALPDDVEEWPTVDVLVPTYNEPLDVVQSTVLAALSIDYPPDRFRVYILDDGRRPEFRQFADACGAGYITRTDNSHAKAGNINNALAQTSAEYVAIFDSDHIPTRSFLQISLGWFLKDARLGMVQTPHHFYSPDPFERNLGIFRKVPNEGALFYGMVQDGNDLWNATFFCGSCAVMRRTALDDIGGIAVETVTEDAHTALRIQRRGWNTAYLALPQAAGLATNTLAEHIQQRIRWARGMVQILRVECPLFASGLTLPQRLCYFNAVIHFLYAAPRLIFLTAPLIYLLFGRSNIYGDVLTIFAYAIPHLAMATLTNSRVQGRFRHSFWNEVYETVLAPYILLPTTFALINPKWGKFNVTPKSGTVSRAYFDWRIAAPFVAIAILTAAGVGLGLWRLSSGAEQTGTIVINVFWSLCNLVTLGASIACAFENRQVRSSARIEAKLPAAVRGNAGTTWTGTTVNLSNGGVAVRTAAPANLEPGDEVEVALAAFDEQVVLPARVVANTSVLRLGFRKLDLEQQAALTRIVYSRADSWLNWRDGREQDSPLRSWAHIVRLSLRGLTIVIRELFVRADAPVRAPDRRQEQPAYRAAAPIVVLMALVLSMHATAAPKKQQQPAPEKPAAEFRDSFDLRSTGEKSPLVLKGLDGRASVSFGIPMTKIISEASMTLVYHAAPGLQPDVSQIHVVLNGSPVASVPVQPGAASGVAARVQISLPSDLLMPENTLTFQLAGSCNGGCRDSSDSFRSQIDVATSFQLTGMILPVPNELRLLPSPFFEPSSQRALRLPFVFADKPDGTVLEAAGVVASWFGVLTDHRGVSFPVSVGRIPPGNVVVFAPAGSVQASELRIPPSSGAVLAVRENPVDPFGKVLAVVGSNSQQILAAARALAIGLARSENTDHVNIAEVRLPPIPKPYQAPRWVEGDGAVKVSDMVSTRGLRVEGTGSVKMYFRLSPDLHFGARKTVPLRLNYRYAGLPRGSKAQVTVRLNGFVFAERTLLAQDSDEVRRETIQLPVATVYPRNTLSVDFSWDRADGTTYAQTETLPQAVILPDSEIDLRGVAHFARLPNLELFAKAGFPYTRVADLSESAVVLPVEPTEEQMSVMLGALGFFGAQTGYPGLRISVLQPEQALVSKKDLLVIGTGEDQPLFSRWQSMMPVRTDRGALRLNDLTNPIEALRAKLPFGFGSERQRLNDLLLTESPEAIVQGFASPAASFRTVVGLWSASARNTEALNSLFDRSTADDALSGVVSVHSGNRYQSFRTTLGRYETGSLGWRDALDYWAARYLLILPLLIVLALYALSQWLRGWLDARAEMRLSMK